MSDEITWSLIDVDIDEIKANPNNPKIKNEAGTRRLRNSLKKYGVVFDGIINQDKSLIDGHSRLKQSAAAGRKTLRMFVPSRQPTEKEYSEMNAIFDLAKAGDADMVMIEETFGEEFMEEWELESQAGAKAKEDAFKIPEIDKIKTDITIGDIFDIGPHRLICGDSTNKEFVEKLLNGIVPVLMVTDPPYGVDYDPDWRNRADRANGKPYGASAIGLVTNDNNASWPLAYKFFPGNIMYIWHAGRRASEVQRDIESAGFKIIMQIIWVKNNIVISRGDYHWKHEPCWYAVRNGANHNWQGSRKECSIWNIDKPLKSETGHSTQKPIECMATPIKNNSKEKDSIYDPFIGSGTTMIASHQLNRKCFAVEIDPRYCQIIIERMFELDPSILILKNGKPYTRFANLIPEEA